MSVMALLCEEPDVDIQRACMMAGNTKTKITTICSPLFLLVVFISYHSVPPVVHDLAEAVVGDITPLDGVCKKEKFIMEEKGLATYVVLNNKLLSFYTSQYPSQSSSLDLLHDIIVCSH